MSSCPRPRAASSITAARLAHTGPSQTPKQLAALSPKRSQTTSRKASTLPYTHSPTAPPPPPTASTPSSVLTHPAIPDLQITLGSTSISIVCPSYGISRPFELDHTWLRDACQEVGSSLQEGTGQKLWETSDVPIIGEQGGEGGLLDQ